MTAKAARVRIPLTFLVLTAMLFALIAYLAVSGSSSEGSGGNTLSEIQLTALTERECQARAARKVAAAKAEGKACPKGAAGNACRANAKQKEAAAKQEEKECVAAARAQRKACEDAAKQAEKDAGKDKAAKKAAQDQRKACAAQFRDCPPTSEYATDPKCK